MRRKFLKGNKSNINLYTNLFFHPVSKSMSPPHRLSTTVIVKPMPATGVEWFFGRWVYDGLPLRQAQGAAIILQHGSKDFWKIYVQNSSCVSQSVQIHAWFLSLSKDAHSKFNPRKICVIRVICGFMKKICKICSICSLLKISEICFSLSQMRCSCSIIFLSILCSNWSILTCTA